MGSAALWRTLLVKEHVPAVIIAEFQRVRGCSQAPTTQPSIAITAHVIHVTALATSRRSQMSEHAWRPDAVLHGSTLRAQDGGHSLREAERNERERGAAPTPSLPRRHPSHRPPPSSHKPHIPPRSSISHALPKTHPLRLTFLRRPEVPGFWPSNGVVLTVMMSDLRLAAIAPTPLLSALPSPPMPSSVGVMPLSSQLTCFVSPRSFVMRRKERREE